jgi:hypothetical protein
MKPSAGLVQIYRHRRHLRHFSKETAAYDNVDRHCYRHRWHDHRHRPPPPRVSPT